MSINQTEHSAHEIVQLYQAKEKKCNYTPRRADFYFTLWLLSRVLKQQYGSSAAGRWHKTETGLGAKVKVARNKNRNERLGLIPSEGGFQRHTMAHQWEQVNALNHEKKVPKMMIS